MQNSQPISKQCASALLEAWCRKDVKLIAELAVNLTSSGYYATDTAESERLEMLAGIATELERCPAPRSGDGLDPCVRLLFHLAEPDGLRTDPRHFN